MLIASLLPQFGSGGVPLLLGDEVFVAESQQPWLLFISVFVWNLVVSGFVLLSLSGLVFFVLPVGLLLVRAWLWGVLLTGLPTSSFLVALPTLILEGEGYVLAGLAGMYLGLSWLSPKRAYGDDGLSRMESLKKAFGECVRIYILVVLFLLAAAVVETLTLVLVF